MAARFAPRAINVTSNPANANSAPRNPPTAPAPKTAILKAQPPMIRRAAPIAGGGILHRYPSVATGVTA